MQNQRNQATNLNTPEAPNERFEYPRDRKNRVQQPSPEVIQAFWRVLQQGNAYWQKYWSKDAPPGTNNQPTTTGEIDSKGIDRRKDAGKVWCWTKLVVDEKKKLWGPWSITPTGTRHWICQDLEPKTTSSKHNESLKSLTPEIIEAEATYALGSYARWHRIREEDPEIICLPLVQTSIAHYHMWVLLDRKVDQARHSEILNHYHSGYPKDDRYQCKDTDRAKSGHGDHFRAPWCWRNGHEILAIRYWCRNEAELIRLGATLKPISLKSKYLSPSRTQDDPIAHYSQIAINNYAWHPSSPGSSGNRHDQRSALVLSMLDHKVPPDIIKQVGINWLKHFEPDASPTRYKAVVSDFSYCVDHTVKELAENKDNKYNVRSPEEYLELESSLIIPFNLHELLNFLQSSNSCSNLTCFQSSNSCSNSCSNCITDSVWTMSILLRGLTSSHPGELINQKQKVEKINQKQKETYNETLLDTFIVICTVEYSKPNYNQTPVFTYKQVLDIMTTRWGGAPNEQRFCRDYVARFAVLDDNKPNYPILQRIVKGVAGYSSTYKMTPVFEGIIYETAKVNEGLLSAFFSPYVAGSPEQTRSPGARK